MARRRKRGAGGPGLNKIVPSGVTNIGSALQITNPNLQKPSWDQPIGPESAGNATVGDLPAYTPPTPDFSGLPVDETGANAGLTDILNQEFGLNKQQLDLNRQRGSQDIATQLGTENTSYQNTEADIQASLGRLGAQETQGLASLGSSLVSRGGLGGVTNRILGEAKQGYDYQREGIQRGEQRLTQLHQERTKAIQMADTRRLEDLNLESKSLELRHRAALIRGDITAQTHERALVNSLKGWGRERISQLIKSGLPHESARTRMLAELQKNYPSVNPTQLAGAFPDKPAKPPKMPSWATNMRRGRAQNMSSTQRQQIQNNPNYGLFSQAVTEYFQSGDPSPSARGFTEFVAQDMADKAASGQAPSGVTDLPTARQFLRKHGETISVLLDDSDLD